MTTTIENLGPAERILQTLLAFTDHAVHNRPGAVYTAPNTNIGVRWEFVTHKVENGEKVVYRQTKAGKKTVRTRIGVMRADNKIIENGQVIAEYRSPGLFPEVVTWIYKQIAEVYKLDNEFTARWASYSFAQENRDLKTILAAFMLVQARKGDAVFDEGKVIFHDDDYRDVAEAMILTRPKLEKAAVAPGVKKGKKTKTAEDKNKDLGPKLLVRIYDVLSLPTVAAINRDLGFTKSDRNPFYGRWYKAVAKWLAHREANPKMLEGLVKAGYRTTVAELCKKAGYKPTTPAFFQTLRWKQNQAKDGRRTMAIGDAVSAAETYAGLTEAQICEKITVDKTNWKRISGMLPKEIGITRAIVVAALEAGSFSDKDVLIYVPTFEELGVADLPIVKAKIETAAKNADNMRAANIARNVKSKELKEKLETVAETVVQKQIEEVSKDIRLYVIVDTSGSMGTAIEQAKVHLGKFLHAFPQDRLHIATFNTMGKEITLKHYSEKGVAQAFQGISASGGTDYGAGVRALQAHKPKDGEDVLMFFVGDEEAPPFAQAVRGSGLNPRAFGLLKVAANGGAAAWRAGQWGVDHNVAVRQTATELGIPCFMVDPATFEDVYAIPRTMAALIQSTPVGAPMTAAKAAPRMSLVTQILATPILQKPVWAS